MTSILVNQILLMEIWCKINYFVKRNNMVESVIPARARTIIKNYASESRTGVAKIFFGKNHMCTKFIMQAKQVKTNRHRRDNVILFFGARGLFNYSVLCVVCSDMASHRLDYVYIHMHAHTHKHTYISTQTGSQTRCISTERCVE